MISTVYSQRIATLQKQLPAMGWDGFLVPRSDPYLNEFVSPSFEYLAFLIGFKGSTGCALVLEDSVLLFVDDRYTIQARLECDWKDVIVIPIKHFSLMAWLKERCQSQQWTLGYDARLHTAESIKRYQTLSPNLSLMACESNPVEALWDDRPPEQFSPCRAHPSKYRGMESEEKRRKIGTLLASHNADVLLVSSPEALAWTLNIRGDDLPYTPVALATLFLDREGQGHLFTHDSCPSPSVLASIGEGIVYHYLAPHEDCGTLDTLYDPGTRVLFDHYALSAWWLQCLRKAGMRVVLGRDPIMSLKATKHPAEQEGMRIAHHQDGVALVRFFHWLEECALCAPSPCDEGMCVSMLARFRQEGSEYLGLSFPTIAASGANGAIVHYIPDGSGDVLEDGSLFLCDSGGQYKGGTTDVTRTVSIGGKPTLQQKKDYTLVLQGHCDLARYVFDKETSCGDLDAIARAPLGAYDLGYSHGTGHGVGAALGVHEAPPGVYPHNSQPLEAGMTLSNEPGLYRQDSYGIRIESVVLTYAYDRETLALDTLTLCPMDRSLIVGEMLSQEQAHWLNAYHKRVFEKLSPHLPQDARAWLKNATKKDCFRDSS